MVQQKENRYDNGNFMSFNLDISMQTSLPVGLMSDIRSVDPDIEWSTPMRAPVLSALDGALDLTGLSALLSAWFSINIGIASSPLWPSGKSKNKQKHTINKCW